MKKLFITLAVISATIICCHAQSIEIEKSFGGYKYIQNDENLSLNDLGNIMQSNHEAVELIKAAKSNNTLVSIIGFAGGGLIGYPLGTAIGGGDPNWKLAGIGAALIVIGIPISSNVNKKTRQAVNLYNKSLNSTSFRDKQHEMNFKITATHLNLEIKF